MRITSEVMVQRSLGRLQDRLAGYERTQSELATGRRIISPSDDPSGARRALSLRAAQGATQRHLSSISDAVGWLDAADAQLQAASARVARVEELAIRGSTEASAGERQAIASEVEQIADELRGIADSRYRDRPLFGGHGDGPVVERLGPGSYAFDPAGTDPAEVIERRVSDSELVRVNVTAAEWLGDDGAGGDLLTLLDGIANDLRTGSPSDVGDRLGALDTAHQRIGASLGDIGAAANRVESARDRAQTQLLTVRTELSDVQDVDVAEAVMELQIQQVGYEATLQALSKALPPSLVAFLR